YRDARTNSLLIAAPEKTMIMLIKLIEEMDVPPAYAATVNVFTLKKADATTVANILTRMFLGTAATGAGGVPAGGAAGAQRPSVLPPFRVKPEGVPSTDCVIPLDERPNSPIPDATP